MKPHMHVLGATLLTCAQSLAQQPRDVPSQLFGITLGAVHDIGSSDRKDLGDLPVAAFAGSNTFLGHGIHYYFRPKAAHKTFPYVEKRKRPSDLYFETSFRLYLLPVIPATIRTMNELETSRYRWEVLAIEWSYDAKSKEAAYSWAHDLCETFRVDIASQPEVLGDYAEKSYTCTFSTGEREFQVRTLGLMRIVALSFKREAVDRKDKAVDAILRRLAADEMRPY